MINTTTAQSGNVSVVTQKSAFQGTLFERANAASTNGYKEGGIGIYVAKPSKPTDVLGGVSIAWKDGKSTIAIVAGWSF